MWLIFDWGYWIVIMSMKSVSVLGVFSSGFWGLFFCYLSRFYSFPSPSNNFDAGGVVHEPEAWRPNVQRQSLITCICHPLCRLQIMKQNSKDCNDRRPNFHWQNRASFTSLFNLLISSLSVVSFTLSLTFSSLSVSLFPIRVPFNTLYFPWPWRVTYSASAEHRSVSPEYAIVYRPNVTVDHLILFSCKQKTAIRPFRASC